MPWLAASPDGIVYDYMEKDHKRGCLEVKCPLSCQKVLFTVACKEVQSFCLVLSNKSTLSLSKSHAYYYQIQTQMRVTHLHWCDFVVWSPIQAVFVERVVYDPVFMKAALQKAQAFYFNKFLPSIVPCMLITNDSGTNCNGQVPLSEMHSILPASVVNATPLVSITTSVPLVSATKITPLVSSTKATQPVPTTTTMPVFETTSKTKTVSATPLVSKITPCTVVTKAVPLLSVTNRISIAKAIPPLLVASVSPVSTTTTTSSATSTDTLEITYATTHTSRPLRTVLHHMKSKKHLVYGDGSCLYHAVVHQAGFVDGNSKGCKIISGQLRQMVVNVMSEHPAVRS